MIQLGHNHKTQAPTHNKENVRARTWLLSFYNQIYLYLCVNFKLAAQTKKKQRSLIK